MYSREEGEEGEEGPQQTGLAPDLQSRGGDISTTPISLTGAEEEEEEGL